jgi:hypothetical protein
MKYAILIIACYYILGWALLCFNIKWWMNNYFDNAEAEKNILSKIAFTVVYWAFTWLVIPLIYPLAYYIKRCKQF